MCLLHNLRHRFVGTVHILTDHPEAVRQDESPDGVDGGKSVSWVETDWRPPVLHALGEKLAGEEMQKTLAQNPNDMWRKLIVASEARYIFLGGRFLHIREWELILEFGVGLSFSFGLSPVTAILLRLLS